MSDVATTPLPGAEDGKATAITVCICTYKRPALLERLLNRLASLDTAGRFSISIVVADNDVARTAEQVVRNAAEVHGLSIIYACEPRQNIALARNEALRHAGGDYVALVDDDELPEHDWLTEMLAACERFDAAGVLGPVRPYFDEPPPRWIIDGGFCDRPEHPTGRIMPWDECRTGNVLFRRRIIAGTPFVFDSQFDTGGEDKDFFMRMTRAGNVFRWCNEGAVVELVPKERWRRKYMLKRALLRGRNILKHPGGQVALMLRSVVAIPLYVGFLPIALLLGQHVFMRYCIKLCDHVGRILALVGLNPVQER